MNKTKRYFVLGIFLVMVFGTLSHFFYEWTNESKLVALFSPVNESTWEHLKLLFFPMLFYTVFTVEDLKEEPCYLSSMIAGNLLGCILIPVLFYTYSGILGFNVSIINIAIFFISVLVAFLSAYNLMKNCKAEKFKTPLITISIIMIILFFVFTFYPPNIGIFISPI